MHLISLILLRVLISINAFYEFSDSKAKVTGASSSTPSQQKTFHPVTSPELGDVELCSMEQPYRVFNVSDILLQIEMLGLLTMMSTIPIHVLCADRCTAEQGCTGFNYKQDVGQCQMYNYVSTSCAVQKSCIHYSVNY